MNYCGWMRCVVVSNEQWNVINIVNKILILRYTKISSLVLVTV